MIAGQMFDLAAESKEIGHVELDRIHRHKTGALITASARCGAVIAGASESDLDAIRRYSSALGLLFQITDDLLDVTASREELGKTPGKDAETMKATYPSIHGLEAASERADVVYSESVDALDSFNRPTAVLRAIAGRVMNRRA
jgi:geranylgeranyl pyrophosphate synthase